MGGSFTFPRNARKFKFTELSNLEIELKKQSLGGVLFCKNSQENTSVGFSFMIKLQVSTHNFIETCILL